nr:uncharacterized protein LOC129383767 isoform X2 [Dermacentor andersoni]
MKTTMITTSEITTLLFIFVLKPVDQAGAASPEQLQREANEDCRSRMLQPGHSFVHWHAVANVTSFYYLCEYDTGIRIDCANGKRANGSRDVVCQVLFEGAVDPYEFKGKCRCTCAKS